MDYATNTPEHRVAEVAQREHGLPDEDLLREVGWVPHDGTDLRDALLAQYRAAEPVARFEDGLKLHAADWAYNGMRSDLNTAQAYGQHIIDMHRAGDLTVHTSHIHAYRRFLAAREREAEAQAAGQEQREPQG